MTNALVDELPESRVAHLKHSAVKKLPEVTLAFWIMKIAATTLGETAGDMFSMTLKIGYFLSTISLFAIFLVTLVTQMKSRRYNPLFYWTVILSTSTAGTTISDFMNRDQSFLDKVGVTNQFGPAGLGIGYPTGAAILISILVAIFAYWKLSGHTFKITEIHSFKGEALFWSAILVSNTLGTSLGDFLSDSSGLGYLGGAALISALLLVLFALMYVPKVSNTLLFWLAFVLTRPLGATVGDFLTKSHAKGGLAFGTYGASAVLMAVLLVLMAQASVKERRQQQRTALQPA
ncbi:MAG: hypothetical protein AAGC46_11345 [Solirubrobacteraceae bacterium]|nr:hypothetical protein [Patulibacter sp.]